MINRYQIRLFYSSPRTAPCVHYTLPGPDRAKYPYLTNVYNITNWSFKRTLPYLRIFFVKVMPTRSAVFCSGASETICVSGNNMFSLVYIETCNRCYFNINIADARDVPASRCPIRRPFTHQIFHPSSTYQYSYSPCPVLGLVQNVLCMVHLHLYSTKQSVHSFISHIGYVNSY